MCHQSGGRIHPVPINRRQAPERLEGDAGQGHARSAEGPPHGVASEVRITGLQGVEDDALFAGTTTGTRQFRVTCGREEETF